MSVTKLTSNIGDIINAERALVRSDEEAKIVTDFLERQSKAAIEARKVNEIEEKRIRTLGSRLLSNLVLHELNQAKPKEPVHAARVERKTFTFPNMILSDEAQGIGVEQPKLLVFSTGIHVPAKLYFEGDIKLKPTENPSSLNAQVLEGYLFVEQKVQQEDNFVTVKPCIAQYNAGNVDEGGNGFRGAYSDLETLEFGINEYRDVVQLLSDAAKLTGLRVDTWDNPRP